MLRIESPPGKHPWATSAPECHLCILQAPIVSGTVQSNSSCPGGFLKQLTLLAAGAIASRVSGLSVVLPQVQRCLEIMAF